MGGCTSSLKRLFFWDLPESRRDPLRSEVIEYVCGALDTEASSRLEDVMGWLERRRHEQPTFAQDAHPFIEALCAAIHERSRHGVVLDNWATLRATVGNQCTVQQSLALESARALQGTRLAGRWWFALEFFRFVGADDERSIAFALYLLEQFHYFTVRTKAEFAELKELRRSPRATARSWETVRALTAFDCIRECASSPPFDVFPGSSWFARIVERTRDDEAAREILDSLNRVLVTDQPPGGDDSYILGQSDDPQKQRQLLDDITSGRLIWRLRGPTPATPVIVLSRERYEIFVQWEHWRKEKTVREIAEGERVLRWFREHRDAIVQRAEQQLREIGERPRRALRSGGHDQVDITIAPLRNIGIRAIAFHPEGHTFPDAGIDIYVRKESPHLVKFSMTLEAMAEMSDEGVEVLYYNSTHLDFGELHHLFVVVIIDLLHRFVVRDRSVRHRTVDPNDTSARAARPFEAGMPVVEGTRAVEVPAYLKPLPSGWRASKRAQVRAEAEQGWKLPPGMTYVRAYHYEGKLRYALPSESVAIYTDDDLFDLGGEG